MVRLGFVAVSWWVGGRLAEACSCPESPPPPCEAYWDAAAVFSGTVRRVSTITVEEKIGGLGKEGRVISYPELSVSFAVETNFLGPASREREVITAALPAAPTEQRARSEMPAQ